MRRFRVLVIGGGASGLFAAIGAARAGASVVVCERHGRIGRKILASGNGRCNLTNDTLNSSFYNPPSRHLVDTVFSSFGNGQIKGIFRELGLFIRSEDGRVFPATNQSSSVLKVIGMELERLKVSIETGFEATSITPSGGGFIVTPRSGGPVGSDTVVIACGGRSYPALGSDGSGYKLAAAMGHRIVPPVPAGVPLSSKDPACHILQGQKIQARVSYMANRRGEAAADGDLLFTKYGLSGTAILDISEQVSIAINRDGLAHADIQVDMAPFVPEDELAREFSMRAARRTSPEDMAAGILPGKFGAVLKGLFAAGDWRHAAKAVKRRTFRITGTRGWNEADFTAGGVETSEVEPRTLESKIGKGIYFSGETLDVNGRRGGYNLAWAWASGFVAGRSAACAR